MFDDDKGKWQSRVQGIPVLSSPKRLLEANGQLRIKEVIIAMPSAPPRRAGELVRMLSRARLPCKTVPSLDQLALGREKLGQLQRVEVQDLLERERIELEAENLRLVQRDRVVLVTSDRCRWQHR